MQRLYRVKFTVDGLPFHIRRDAITGIREQVRFEREQINPQTGEPYKAGERDMISGAPWVEDAEGTVVTVVLIGTEQAIMVEESLADALDAWDV